MLKLPKNQPILVYGFIGSEVDGWVDKSSRYWVVVQYNEHDKKWIVVPIRQHLEWVEDVTKWSYIPKTPLPDQADFKFIRGDIRNNRFKWIGALRSGLWRQTKAYLAAGWCNSALGVAASLTPYCRVLGEKPDILRYGRQHETVYAPIETTRELGLRTLDGQFILENRLITSVWELQQTMTFDQIASILEDKTNKLLWTDGPVDPGNPDWRLENVD